MYILDLNYVLNECLDHNPFENSTLLKTCKRAEYYGYCFSGVQLWGLLPFHNYLYIFFLHEATFQY